MSDIANLGFSVDTSGLSKGKTALDGFAETGERTEKRTSASAKKTAKALGGVGRSAGQAGIQVQQFVGQLQGGVAPMVALAQQGADLGIVLGAPLVGVMVSLGAVLLGTLTPSLMQSKKATELLDEALKQLKQTVDVSDKGLVTLSEALVRLSNVSEDVARAKMAEGIIEAEKAAKQAAVAIGDAFEVFEADYGFSNVTDFIDALVKGGGFLKGSYEGFYEVAQELGEEFGLTGQAAEDAGSKIIRMAAELQRFPTPERFAEFQVELSKMSTSADSGTDDAKRFAGSLSEIFMKAEDATSAVELIRQKLEELGAGNSVEDIVGDPDQAEAIQKITGNLQQQVIALRDGRFAAEEYAIAQALGLETIASAPQGIKDLLEDIRQLKAEQEAAEAFESLSSQLESQKIKILEGADAFEIYSIRMKAIAAGVAPDLIKQLIASAKANQKLRKEMDETLKDEKDLKKLTFDLRQ